MTDICLLVYFLPHVSLCGFIHYLINYKFATNDDNESWSIFTIGTLRSTKEKNVVNNVVLPVVKTQISQVPGCLFQTALTWANAGVCSASCAHALGIMYVCLSLFV